MCPFRFFACSAGNRASGDGSVTGFQGFPQAALLHLAIKQVDTLVGTLLVPLVQCRG